MLFVEQAEAQKQVFVWAEGWWLDAHTAVLSAVQKLH